MRTLTYHQLFDYWVRHRKITIHMHDKNGRHTAFAISTPHSKEYIDELHARDSAERKPLESTNGCLLHASLISGV